MEDAVAVEKEEVEEGKDNDSTSKPLEGIGTGTNLGSFHNSSNTFCTASRSFESILFHIDLVAHFT